MVITYCSVEITRLSSHVVYQNRWMKVREDEIERRDGSRGIFGVVEKPDFVLIIPSDDTGFLLAQQYRYPVGQRLWEFPQGSWEHDSTADPADVARAELLEEVGMDAHNMRYLGHLFEACGYSTQGFHVFHATDLHPRPRRTPREEQDLVARHVDFSGFAEMIRSGELKDAPSLAAYTLLRFDEAGDGASGAAV